MRSHNNALVADIFPIGKSQKNSQIFLTSKRLVRYWKQYRLVSFSPIITSRLEIGIILVNFFSSIAFFCDGAEILDVLLVFKSVYCYYLKHDSTDGTFQVGTKFMCIYVFLFLKQSKSKRFLEKKENTTT